MRKILLFIGLVLVSWVSAQEINCTVTINSDLIEGTNKQVYQTLKAGIEDYMNQNRWTNMTYADNEKIECSMLIVVKKLFILPLSRHSTIRMFLPHALLPRTNFFC